MTGGDILAAISDAQGAGPQWGLQLPLVKLMREVFLSRNLQERARWGWGGQDRKWKWLMWGGIWANTNTQSDSVHMKWASHVNLRGRQQKGTNSNVTFSLKHLNVHEIGKTGKRVKNKSRKTELYEHVVLRFTSEKSTQSSTREAESRQILICNGYSLSCHPQLCIF